MLVVQNERHFSLPQIAHARGCKKLVKTDKEWKGADGGGGLNKQVVLLCRRAKAAASKGGG